MSGIFPWRDGLQAPKGEEGDRILAKNFEVIANSLNKTGLYLAGSATVKTEQTTVSSSYIDVSGLKLSVNLSGGLIIVVAAVQCGTAANDIFLRLQNGTDTLDETGLGNSGTLVDKAVLWWMGNVTKGQNVFKVQGRSNSGALVTFNKAPTAGVLLPSNIYVLEYLKGQ